MARVIRDDAGNIIDIIESSSTEQEQNTPWGAPLPDSIVDSKDVETLMPASKGSETKVLSQLESMAAQAAPVQRHTSAQESQWLADLVAKYGEDTEAMARDPRLNLWQKTQGEIKRAIKKAGGFGAFK
ncbi:hypothetical protein [Sporisorium scitamineum]|nr:hypothetical protein [Sporisorium scitamineum]